MSIIDNIKIRQNFGEKYEFENETQDESEKFGFASIDDEVLWLETKYALSEAARKQDEEKKLVIKLDITEFDKRILDWTINVYDDKVLKTDWLHDVEEIRQMNREELEDSHDKFAEIADKLKRKAALCAVDPSRKTFHETEKIHHREKAKDVIKRSGFTQVGDTLPLEGWNIEELNEENLITINARNESSRTAKFIMDKEGKWYQRID